MLFSDFFQKITGSKPYPYQQTLGENPWPDILRVPTGLGKTAATVVTSMWKWLNNHPDMPRRLVYCLPMRVLVEQTISNARAWSEKAEQIFASADKRAPQVFSLMGGEVDDSWTRYPERPAILIGTQDMLISRALMRGYGQSPYQWPNSFALLHNDAQWVFDEVQLMGSSLITSAQIEAFRRALGCWLPAKSLWMSATLTENWLGTVDFKQHVSSLSQKNLSDADLTEPQVKLRYEANKPLEKYREVLSKGNNKKFAKTFAQDIVKTHQPATLTLVVVNTVERAAAVYEQLEKAKSKAELLLIHSRFRGSERELHRKKLSEKIPAEGRIIVSTQVIEAGVDIDARCLFTELAPWASMVQRFGRCNRSGLQKDPRVFWVDLEEKFYPPYDSDDLICSRKNLFDHTDASPANLRGDILPPKAINTIRKKDMIELFDTSPDLAGCVIDVSPFIRESTDHDAQLFWRGFEEQGHPPADISPDRNELCPAPVFEIRKWLEKKDAFRWNSNLGEWERINNANVLPGMIILVDASLGGYSEKRGWAPDKAGRVQQVEIADKAKRDFLDRDLWSETVWQTLRDHSQKVAWYVDHFQKSLKLSCDEFELLKKAALLHDIGKAHPVFQLSMLGNTPENDPKQIWAKTVRKNVRHSRPRFRHELASAAVVLAQGYPDLIAYLVAAHHGKVRMTVRSHPNELLPEPMLIEGRERKFALGIWDGDTLPAFDVSDNLSVPETAIDLSFMEMGENESGASWISRSAELLSKYGPFRLGYLEALLRAADCRASEVSREK